MIVLFTKEAEADLERIGDYIAKDNPPREATFVEELIAQCERLAETPEGYALVPRYEHSGARRRPYGRYLIFYRAKSETIEILHILNGAQDYEAILSGL